MPQLPDIQPSFGNLENPLTPVSERSTATYQPGVIPEAIGQVAAGQEKFASDLLDKQNEIGKAYAESHVMTKAMEAERQAELEPDPVKAKQLYDTSLTQATQEGAAMVPGPLARQDFLANVGRVTFWSDRNLNQILINKQKDAGLASLTASGQNILNNYSQSNDPDQRSQLLDTYHRQLTAAKAGGLITQEQFEKQTRDFAIKASQAYYELHPDELQADLQKKLSATSSTGSNPFNLGNVKTPTGAAAGTQEFQKPATPIDGVILTANTLRSGYQGLTLQQIGAKWTGEPSDKVRAWVNNASKVSGLAPDQTPDLNDPGQLKNLLAGIATAEKSAADRKNFTDDVIDKGVQASLAGQQPQLEQPTVSKTGKPIDNIPPYEALVMAKEAEARGNILTRMQEQQLKQQQEDKMNNYLTRGLKGEPTSDIVDDKTLTFEQREHVLTALNSIAKNGDKTNDQLFTRLFQNIHTADNDPDKITDPQTLVPYVGNGLSKNDYDYLRKEIAGNGTPEGKAEGVMKQTLLKAAEKKLVLTPLDEDGQNKFGAFQAWFLPAYDKARASGKTADQLLNPDSPDYMGKAVNAFDRPQAQRLADQLKDPMQYTPPERTAIDVRADYKSGKITRDEAKKELLGFGYK